MSDMQTYIISESEYPDEGCYLIEAPSKEDAVKQWLEETGTKPGEEPELSVAVATPLLLALHAADDAREAANATYEAIRKMVDVESAGAKARRRQTAAA
ncbi:hypothetical protein [Myxococcus landrumensis]|uniref:Uncharacterized protein n=1 Tax=Myxococcus landrumensis TaxID=2813577 RepID=A0ABX7N5L5_9BACT|nr:hypothetical protein [Myxococcus landrumus]QSQ14025.1 hypothetical protein JY572_37885 [Myxococcus landrumus]